MRFLGLVAACAAAALTACSAGGPAGVVPPSQQSLAGALRATTIATVGRSASDRGDCEGGGRHENAAARGAQERDGEGDGHHGDHQDHGNSCCPPATGTGDNQDGEHQDYQNTACCPTASGTGGTPGTRDRDRQSDDEGGDKHHGNGTGNGCHVPGPLTVTPGAITINCIVRRTGSFTVAGTPAGLSASVVDGKVATVGPPVTVGTDSVFVVTGLAGLSTTIVLTDTAGDTGTVTVTLLTKRTGSC